MSTVEQNYKVDELLTIAVAHYERYWKDTYSKTVMDDEDAARLDGKIDGYHAAMEMIFGFNKWTDAVKAANATY